jgi:hypothetical protein
LKSRQSEQKEKGAEEQKFCFRTMIRRSKKRNKRGIEGLSLKGRGKQHFFLAHR